MNTVPNAVFDASFPPDAEFDHPQGVYFARRLHGELARLTAERSDFDNWRDCGWALECSIDGRRFEVYFAQHAPEVDPNRWLIGVAPVGQPGAFKRLFGAKRNPDLEQCRALTREIHRILKADPHVSNVRWAMDADPLESGAVDDPERLDWGRD